MPRDLTAEASITAEVDIASTRRARTETLVGEIRRWDLAASSGLECGLSP
jgi:hypothetical protein